MNAGAEGINLQFFTQLPRRRSPDGLWILQRKTINKLSLIIKGQLCKFVILRSGFCGWNWLENLDWVKREEDEISPRKVSPATSKLWLVSGILLLSWLRLVLEDKLHEGGVEVVSNIFVLFLFGNEFVCKVIWKDIFFVRNWSEKVQVTSRKWFCIKAHQLVIP